MEHVKAYFGFLVTFLVIDAVWISSVVKPLYQREVGHLLAESPNMAAAVVFYLGYALGVVVLAIKPAKTNKEALLLGGFFGLLAYGTFTVTNYALLEGWSATILFSDLAWGAFITGISACVGYLAAEQKTIH